MADECFLVCCVPKRDVEFTVGSIQGGRASNNDILARDQATPFSATRLIGIILLKK